MKIVSILLKIIGCIIVCDVAIHMLNAADTIVNSIGLGILFFISYLIIGGFFNETK